MDGTDSQVANCAHLHLARLVARIFPFLFKSNKSNLFLLGIRGDDARFSASLWAVVSHSMFQATVAVTAASSSNAETPLVSMMYMWLLATHCLEPSPDLLSSTAPYSASWCCSCLATANGMADVAVNTGRSARFIGVGVAMTLGGSHRRRCWLFSRGTAVGVGPSGW